MSGEERLPPTSDSPPGGGTPAPTGLPSFDPGVAYPPPTWRGRKSVFGKLPWVDWALIFFVIGTLCTVVYSWTRLDDRVDVIGEHIKTINENVQKESDTVQALTTNITVQQHDIEEMKSDIKDLKNDQETQQKRRK